MAPLGKQTGGQRMELDGEPVTIELLGVEQSSTGKERRSGRGR